MTASHKYLRTRTKLWPGELGTKRHLRRYGDRLVCVRYLYDPERRLRFTTVELVVDQGPWTPRPAHNPEAIVAVRVAPGESAVYRLVRAAGGVWNPEQMVWLLPQRTVSRLGLQERVVPLRPVAENAKRPPPPPNNVPTNTK